MMFARMVYCENIVGVQYSVTLISHENRSDDKRRTVELEVVRMEWTAVELLIQPSQDANFRCAERFEPAIDEKALTRTRGRNLLRFGDH